MDWEDFVRLRVKFEAQGFRFLEAEDFGNVRLRGCPGPRRGLSLGQPAEKTDAFVRTPYMHACMHACMQAGRHASIHAYMHAPTSIREKMHVSARTLHPYIPQVCPDTWSMDVLLLKDDNLSV